MNDPFGHSVGQRPGPRSIDNGVDMRTTLALTGIAAGVALTLTVQRWTPSALWWLFGNGE